MNRTSLAFFSVAPVYVLIGMVWGIMMAESQDHSLMPAHAHLNLLGFVLNGIMGAFYGLAGERATGKLAWANFFLFNAGVIVMIPTLVQILSVTGGPPPASLIVTITVAEVLAILGVLLFAINVWKQWAKKA